MNSKNLISGTTHLSVYDFEGDVESVAAFILGLGEGKESATLTLISNYYGEMEIVLTTTRYPTEKELKKERIRLERYKANAPKRAAAKLEKERKDREKKEKELQKLAEELGVDLYPDFQKVAEERGKKLAI